MSAPKSEASDKAAPLPSDGGNNGNVSKVKPAAMTLPEGEARGGAGGRNNLRFQLITLTNPTNPRPRSTDGSQPENVMMAGVTPAHKTKPEQPKLWG